MSEKIPHNCGVSNFTGLTMNKSKKRFFARQSDFSIISFIIDRREICFGQHQVRNKFKVEKHFRADGTDLLPFAEYRHGL